MPLSPFRFAPAKKTFAHRLLLACILGCCLLLETRSARADDFSLENIDIHSGVYDFQLKKIDFVGANMSREAALALFDKASDEPIIDRLNRLGAEKISTPEMTVLFRHAAGNQQIVYRDLVLQGLSRGRLRTVDAANVALEMKGTGAPMKGRYGALHAEDIYLDKMLGWYVATPPANDVKSPVIGVLVMTDLNFETGLGQLVTIGSFRAKGFAAKIIAQPLLELTQKLEASAQDNKGEPDSKMMTALFSMILDNFDVAAMEFLDIKAPSAKDQPVVSVNRIALNNVANSKIGENIIEGFSVEGKEAEFRLERFTLSGLDLKPALLAAAQTPASSVWPRFNALKIENLSVAAKAINAPPDQPKLTTYAIGALNIEAQDWLARGPAIMHMRADGVIVDHSMFDKVGLNFLAGLDYPKVVLSSILDTTFDADKQTFAVNSFVLDEPSIGNVALSFSFGDVSADLFGGDSERTRALMAQTFKQANMQLTNKGLLDRFVSVQAKKANEPESLLRQRLADYASSLAVAFLGGRDSIDQKKAASVGDAIARFVRGDKTLELIASAPTPARFLDIVIASQMGSVMETIKVDANTR